MNKIKMIIPIVLAMVMVFGGCLTAHAYTGNEELPIYGSGYDLTTLTETIHGAHDDEYYIIYKTTDNSIVMFCGQKGLSATSTKIKASGWSCLHKLKSSGWTSCASGLDGYIEIATIEELLYTSHDLYKGDILFFRHPSLLGEMEIRTIPQIVTEQMKIILITAVCCLALLISSLLLPRVLRKFL